MLINIRLWSSGLDLLNRLFSSKIIKYFSVLLESNLSHWTVAPRAMQ